jgi:dTDP-glucose 4,6-dehydratase
MKVLITGGLGFIFSHVTEYMVKKGYNVVVIDNESVGSHPEIIDGSFKYYNTNCALAKDIIVQENPEYIIHAAAYSDVDFSIKSPSMVMDSNNSSSIAVFEAARQCSNLKKLVYVSTDEVYGECDVRKTEEDIIFPKNPYSCSKAFGSLVRITYDNTYPELKDKTAETRFCNVFGERQDNRKVMSAIKESIEDGRILPIHNEGLGSREYIYVHNIPPAVELVMLKGDRTYNITLNDSYTVKELITKVETVTGKKTLTTPSERKGMDMKYQMDNARILELGWKPNYTFEDGIKHYFNA